MMCVKNVMKIENKQIKNNNNMQLSMPYFLNEPLDWGLLVNYKISFLLRSTLLLKIIIIISINFTLSQ